MAERSSAFFLLLKLLKYNGCTFKKLYYKNSQIICTSKPSFLQNMKWNMTMISDYLELRKGLTYGWSDVCWLVSCSIVTNWYKAGRKLPMTLRMLIQNTLQTKQAWMLANKNVQSLIYSAWNINCCWLVQCQDSPHRLISRRQLPSISFQTPYKNTHFPSHLYNFTCSLNFNLWCFYNRKITYWLYKLFLWGLQLRNF